MQNPIFGMNKSAAADPFAGIGDIKVYNRGVYLRNVENKGNYVVRIESVKTFPDRKGIWCFAVSCVCLHSTNSNITVGTELSYFLKNENDSFLFNVKRFVSAAAGVEPDEVDQEGVHRICSDEQPLAGTIVAARVEIAQSKMVKPGQDPHEYAKVMWRTMSDEETAQYAGK